MKAFFIGLLALLIILLGSLALVLGTSSGSRWALARVPGLAVENFTGRLGGQWAADRVQWQQGATRLDIKAADFAWSPACLLRMRLCVERLHAEQVSLQLPTSEAAPSDQPLSLPDLKLPLSIELGDVQVGDFQLDGAQQLSELNLDAHWTAAGLQIDRLHARRDALVLDLAGTVVPGQQWPLDLSGQLQLPEVDGKPWQLALTVKGDLLASLALSGQSTGYLDGQLAGELQPLAEHLPASLRITSAAFKAGSSLPDTLTLNQLELNAAGNLQAGYQIDGKASLPAEQGAMSLLLKGRVDAKGADIQALNVAGSEAQRVTINGRVDWQEALSVDAKLDWLDFPWQRLYPTGSEPPVKVHQFTTDLTYRGGNYLGNFKGSFDGPAGAFTLASPFSGDLGQVFLPQLQLVAGQGKADGYLKLQFADGIGWDTALDLSALDPAFWVAEMPGTLAGPLRSKGELKNEQLTLNADLDLKGRLRGQPAVLKAQAQGGGEQWTLGALDIRLGDNRISGSGSLQQRLAGKIDLALPRLGQLWPRLQGSANGQLNVAGTLQVPQGTFKLQGQQLTMAENRLQSLNMAAALDASQKASVDLTAAGIRAGETALGTLTAKGGGDIRRQQLQLNLDGPQLKVTLAGDGNLDRGNWRGRLASGQIQGGGQAWALQAPARLERLASGQMSFGAHCWLSGQASLCGEDQRLAPDPRLRYHLKQFPLESLAQWMPKDFAWKGLLNADIQLDIPAAGPSGQVVVDASNGTMRIRDNGQWLDFPYQSLRLDSRLTPRRIDTQFSFRGDRLGDLQVNTQINPLPANKPITGSFSLKGLDLSVARPFVPMVEKLAGTLSGNGQISGGLLAPQVNGVVNLNGGEVSGGELPVSLENLQVQAQIAGESVQLNGNWKSGKAGQGSLSGQIGWADALAVDLQLKGSQLPVTVEPYAELEATPDLRIRMDAGRLSVAGKVLIPKGAITVRELPPSTVKVSEDARIVGQQTEEGETPLPMAMDINVQVGSDKLSFSGFGLTANLAGYVHIGDNMDTRGELSLNDGRYRAYGQRLTIRRARLLFAGPIDQPYLDIEAIRQTDDVIAGIRLSGSAEQPTTEVFSEPAMSQEQALSYLVLGRPLSTNGEDNNMLAQAALGLGLAGSSGVTTKLATDLGIEDFQLDTQGSGDATSVVASGNISERLSLRYGVGVFEPANTIALRYLLSKRVYVEVASGVASSLDLFYKRDF